MAKIGIYWDEFNPIHSGQIRFANQVMEAYELDELRLLTTADTSAEFFLSATVEDRLDLLFYAAEEIPFYSVMTTGTAFERLSAFLAGERQITHLLLDEMHFLTLDRDLLKTLPQKVTLVIRGSETMKTRLEKKIEELGVQAQIFVMDKYLPTAVTVARMIFLGCGEYYLPADVLDRILENGLYVTKMCLKDLPFMELQHAVAPLYEPKRRAHAMGCSLCAEELAKQYGADPTDARRAGILHDITKALPVPEQLHLCQKYAIMTDDYPGEMAKILHGKTAATVSQVLFGEREAVCDAISWHTTGKANMSLLCKIIYIADYIEPCRDFDGVEELRKLASTNLDVAVLQGIEMTIEILKKRNTTLNLYSVEARDYLLLGEIT